MKTNFSSISSYRDLSISDFLKLASLMYMLMNDNCMNIEYSFAFLLLKSYFEDLFLSYQRIPNSCKKWIYCIIKMFFTDLPVVAQRKRGKCAFRTHQRNLIIITFNFIKQYQIFVQCIDSHLWLCFWGRYGFFNTFRPVATTGR